PMDPEHQVRAVREPIYAGKLEVAVSSFAVQSGRLILICLSPILTALRPAMQPRSSPKKHKAGMQAQWATGREVARDGAPSDLGPISPICWRVLRSAPQCRPVAWKFACPPKACRWVAREPILVPNTKPNWRVWMQFTGIGRQARPNNQIEIDGLVSA